MTETSELNAVDTLLRSAHDELNTPPQPHAVARLQDFASWRSTQRKPAARARRIAWVFSILWILDLSFHAWYLRLFQRGQPWRPALAVCVPLLVFWAATRLAHRSEYVSQVGARVLLATLCMVGASAGVFQNPNLTSQLGIALRHALPLLAVPGALGVTLVLGGHGLRTPQRNTPRTGFDSILSLSLIMGLADALFLLCVGLTELDTVGFEPWAFILPAFLGFAAYGLARGRVWGLLAMALANLAEVVLLFSGMLFSGSLITGMAALVLILTATVQLLLPAPVYAAMLSPSRAWVEHLQSHEESVARVLTVVVAVLLGLSTLLAVRISDNVLAVINSN